MRNYLCWEPNAVRQVINPFAEHMPDSLFRAVHSDWNLNVSPPVGKSFQEISDAAWRELTPSEFLADFLREERPHALAAILGETGSGKSHLVHWMRLNIRPDEKHLLLVVPKSGTSLRAIVKMIIEKLPKAEQQSFLDTLQSAGDGTQNRSDQKQQLLNDLAQVIREEVLAADADEIEQELVRHLPHLFQDPHMRATHFLADSTIVAEIIDHIFAPSNAQDRPDKRRSFVDTDLPLGGMDFANASKQARDAMHIIELDPAAYLPLAIKIINRNLDRAVARTLSFSGDRVEELMARLRTHLKSQGKELVLLVEEFARLQGIDRALLQAITSHGDDRQCKMRSAIAVTTGFFKSVAETAYMRTTHIVDMDRSAGRAEGRSVTMSSLGYFASRYLNAVRLGRAEIERWNESAGPGDNPPSRCANCPHRGECHATFGAIDGYGLYPFTPRALWNSASRADSSMPESLNPRILQNDLLVQVLDNYGETITTGNFPPYRLLEKLGGVKMLPLTAQVLLQNRNPQVFQRWEAFLELYDGSGEIKNLEAPLREAFGVPEIPDAAVAPVIKQGEDDGFSERLMPAVASREDQAIEAWINGKGLDQTVASQLRPLIFTAIADAIDWDMLGLEKTSFVGTTGRAFQTNSISFDRQMTQIQEHLQVKIRVPGDLPAAPTVGTALQGLLRASKQQFRWNFDDGEKMLAAFLDCIEVWSKSVEDQLRKVCAPTPAWNQAKAALELLCVGAAIGGKIRPDASIAEMIDGAFSSWPSECASTANDMRTTYHRLVRGRDKIVSAARAQLSSMKGGQVGAMLNPGRIVGAIRDIRQSKWRLGLEPPEDDRSDVAKLYRETRADLASAATAEMAVRQKWLSEMEAAFGPDAIRSTIAATLEGARQAALDAGIGSSNTSKALLDALERLRGTNFDDSILAARALVKQDDALAALAHFGRGRQNAVEAGTALVTSAKAFLDAVDQNLETYGHSHTATHGALAHSLSRIDASLRAIETDLTSVSAKGEEAFDAA
ncbi:protein DpdH [Mesorhizobium sp. ES1-6]|uniref:protein DpdH n=1 Tax=Mesorhizobium sp. ES1-6 TaxID=2876626 RepID=UPI001CCD2555|nr:protein DpdH [Mesorhizobium sp. ES1-6]MBZ9803380.1 ATP-binding protein [Mesorhizobium sp. ES1-6]